MNPPVLIVTREPDNHAPLVCTQLEKLGAGFLVFKTEDYLKSAELSFATADSRPDTTLRLGSDTYCGEDFSAVYLTNLFLPRAPHIADAAARQMAESERRAALSGILMALPSALWMNHPQANQVSRNKILQLRLACAIGFAVPNTIVTNRAESVRDAFRMWKGEMVAKLVGGQVITDSVESQYVIYTSPVTEEDLRNDDAISACPAIYQQFVKKKYELRVTVVGNEIFGCRIDTASVEPLATDWRAVGYHRLSLAPFKIDDALAAKCLALMRRLNLEVAGIDLIVTPDDDVVFLEINAAGQWAWVEEMTGLPIAATIARRLVGATLRL